MVFRRIAIVVMMTLLLLVSAAAGLLAADWPFYKRVFNLPKDSGEWPESFYQPVASIRGNPAPFFPAASPEELTIDPQALESAAQWAGDNNSVALLVLHRGKVQIERYWQGMSANQLYSGRAMSRSLLALVYGVATNDGTIASLDAPVGDYLREWQRRERGRITLRELGQNVSGLEEAPMAPPRAPPGASAYTRAVTSLQAIYGKNSRLSLGSDFAGTALSFKAAHEPGLRFALSNASSQLLGVAIERASGMGYEQYVQDKVWSAIGAGRAEFYMDRANGMPAVYCCFRASPHDWLRVGAVLLDGTVDGKRLLSEKWLAELRVTSRTNPLYGFQLWTGRAQPGVREYVQGSGLGVTPSEPFVTDDVLWLEGGGARTIWVVPSQQLVILRLGRQSPTWDGSMLPNTILRGIKP